MSAVSAAAQESSNGGSLETIVVTAQKRQENLQVVPVAVTALTSQTLQEMRYQNLGSISAVAPGVTVRDGPGGGNTPNVTIRGIYGSGTFASDPGVALYIDGMYLSSVNGAEFDLADVERVEVLRGPQGTLFGRNAIGGAVNVITKEPTGKFDGTQEFSFGNLNQFRSKTAIDLPAWGMLSASVAYLHDQSDGDVRNLGAGTVWNYGPATGGRYGLLTSPSTLGGHDTNAVSAALKLETDSNIKAVYRFTYSHKEFSPDASGILTFNTGDPALSGIFQGLWAAQNPAIRTPISATRPDAVNNWYSTTDLNTDQTHNLTISVPVGDSVTIKDLTAYRKVSNYATNQLDGFGGLIGAPNTPILPIENDTQSFQKSFQEELQANVDTKWVKSTLGYMHFWSHTIEGGLYGVANAPFGNGLFPPSIGGPPYTNFVATNLPGVVDDDVSLKSDAFYTQNEIHVLPKLDLVLGGRYTWDRRYGLDNSPTPAAAGVPVNYSDSTPTYLVGLNYKINDNIFTYAKLSSAYITGGRLANIPFLPSFAKSHEAGVKSDLLDHTLRVNLAGYTVKYTALQVLTNPEVGCASVPGVSAFASQCIVDGGDERASGFEGEVTYVPVNGLTLAGNVGYTHATLKKTPPSLLSPDGYFTNGFIPAWTADISAQYRGPDMDSLHDAHVIGRIEGEYSSSAYSSTPTSLHSVSDAAKIPGRMIVDARLGLAGFQVGGTDVEVAGYAKNLTNNKSIIYAFNASALIPVEYQFARTYGIDINVGF